MSTTREREASGFPIRRGIHLGIVVFTLNNIIAGVRLQSEVRFAIGIAQLKLIDIPLFQLALNKEPILIGECNGVQEQYLVRGIVVFTIVAQLQLVATIWHIDGTGIGVMASVGKFSGIALTH